MLVSRRRVRVAFSALQGRQGPRWAMVIQEQGQLERRIDEWHDAIQILMPAAASRLAGFAKVANTIPSQDRLLLLPSVLCSDSDVTDCLLMHEYRLREAQAYDSLANLRGHLVVIAYLRDRASQEPNIRDKAGRMHVLLDVIQEKVRMEVRRYHAAHAALVTLRRALHEPDDHGHLRELKPTDVRYISEANEDSFTKASWIWLFGLTALLDPASRLDLRINKELESGMSILYALFGCTHALTLSTSFAPGMVRGAGSGTFQHAEVRVSARRDVPCYRTPQPTSVLVG